MGDPRSGEKCVTSFLNSLGCVLYEMLTGDPPYMGSAAQAVLGQIERIILTTDFFAELKRRFGEGHP